MVAETITVEQRARAILEQRHSLGAFARGIMPDSYEQPAQVLAVIEVLEAVERRELNRVIITEPPRSSKSTHVSRLFPADYLGKHPDHGIVLSSYGDLLATTNGRAVRDLLSNPQYPYATRLRADMKAAGMWGTDKGGGLLAGGVGTGLTGFGGHVLVADDLIKGREEAESEIVRESTWNWHEEVFMTRLQRGGAIIETGTRWHEDDVIGRILNSKGQASWHHLNIPYVAEADDVLGREVGETLTLFGEVPPDLSAYAFSALYQQRPTPAGGGVFKAAWMQRRYCTCGDPLRCGNKPLPVTSPRWQVIQSADLGGKQGVGHDPSALATWGTDGISRYVMDYWSSQAEYADVKAEFTRQSFAHDPLMLFVEDATWAQPLISDLRHAGIRVQGIPPIGSKWTRADDVSNDFAGGLVVLPEAAPWLDSWMHEHLGFPNAAHDEAVDTTSLALSMLKRTQQTYQQRIAVTPAKPLNLSSLAQKRLRRQQAERLLTHTPRVGR